jgi:CHAD domain-containing protein
VSGARCRASGVGYERCMASSDSAQALAGSGFQERAALVVGVFGLAVMRALEEHAARERRAEEERALQQRRKFRLHDDEGVADGLRRIARGQIDGAVEGLRDRDGTDVGEAVHDARKRFKRLRALVRLGRDELGTATYRRENTAFRDAGRGLAGARDAKVLVETLDAVRDAFADELPDTAFAGLRARLVEEARAAHDRLEDDEEALRAVLDALNSGRARVATWPLDTQAGYDALAPGFARIYRRGRRAYAAAAEDPDAEALHELRKRVKDLWHAAQIARPVAPKRMKKLARRASRLSDVIGDDHDLAVLSEAAAARADTMGDEERGLLQTLIDRRRRRLQAAALAQARRLYAAKPKQLARRFAVAQKAGPPAKRRSNAVARP